MPNDKPVELHADVARGLGGRFVFEMVIPHEGVGVLLRFDVSRECLEAVREKIETALKG